MPKRVNQIIIDNSDIIIKNWLEIVSERRRSEYTSTISEDLFQSTNREFVNVISQSAWSILVGHYHT